jgi:hypothetical protein
MSAFLAKIAQKIFEYLFVYLTGKLIDLIRDYQAKQERKKIDQINLKKYREAIEGKLSDEEISKAAENLLNGRDSSLS